MDRAAPGFGVRQPVQCLYRRLPERIGAVESEVPCATSVPCATLVQQVGVA